MWVPSINPKVLGKGHPDASSFWENSSNLTIIINVIFTNKEIIGPTILFLLSKDAQKIWLDHHNW